MSGSNLETTLGLQARACSISVILLSRSRSSISVMASPQGRRSGRLGSDYSPFRLLAMPPPDRPRLARARKLCPVSHRLEVGAPDHLGPLVGFVGNEPGEL